MDLLFSVRFFRHHRWLQAMALCTGIVRFPIWELRNRLGNAVRRLCGNSYRNHSVPVQLLCSLQAPHGNHMTLMRLRTKAARRWCGDCARAIWLSQVYHHSTIFFYQNDHLKSCIFYKISARSPHNARTMLLLYVCGLIMIFFKFVISPH